jgi:formylglycine-generating enzyme required for sulfatase activity
MNAKHHLVIMLLICGLNTIAQTAKITKTTREKSKIQIYYDLEEAQQSACDVNILCSADNGKTWNLLVKTLTGDIGKGIKPGKNKKIEWDVLKDQKALPATTAKFRLEVKKTEDLDINTINPTMIEVSGGTFWIGAKGFVPDENPPHQVLLNDFFIGKYEVTNLEFIDFLNDIAKDMTITYDAKIVKYKGNPVYHIFCDNCSAYINRIKYDNYNNPGGLFSIVPGFENHPVNNVTWFGAKAYCDWLSLKTGKAYRLPTEAEWEVASKGGNSYKGLLYPGSNNLDDVAWIDKNASGSTHIVGQKKPNGLNIYDMGGNVWEWCADYYDENYYKASPDKNPTGPATGKLRVNRGGGWYTASTNARSTKRDANTPDKAYFDLGFRIALSKK